MATCARCGARVEGETNFCTVCGAGVVLTRPTAPTAPPAPTVGPAAAPTRDLGRNLRAAAPLGSIVGVLVSVLGAAAVAFGVGVVRGWLAIEGIEQGSLPWWGARQLLLVLGADVGPGGSPGAPAVELVSFTVVLGVLLRLLVFRGASRSRGLRLAGTAVLAVVYTVALVLVLALAVSVSDVTWVDLYGIPAAEGGHLELSVDAARAMLFAPVLVLMVVLVAATNRSAPRIAEGSILRAPAVAVTGAFRLLAVVIVLGALTALPVLASGRQIPWAAGALLDRPVSDWGASGWLGYLDASFVWTGLMQGMTVPGPLGLQETVGVFGAETSTYVLLAAAVTLLVPVVVGLRIGTQLPLAMPRRLGVLLLPVVHPLLWVFFIKLLSGQDFDVLDLPVAVGISFTQGLVCALCAAFLLPALLGKPRLASLFAGSGTHPEVAARLIADRQVRHRPVPAYLAAAARSRAPASAIRRNVQRAAGITAVAGLAGAALLLTSSSPSYANSAGVACGSLMTARETADVQPPSKEPTGTFKKAIDDASSEMDRSRRESDGLLRGLPAGTLDLPQQLASANEDLATAEGKISGADRRVRQAQRELKWADDTEWAEDQLQTARDDYEMFREYDTDGFWADQVSEAEKDLAKAEAAVADERAALDAATADRAEIQQEVDAARARVTDLSTRLSPYQATIDAVDAAESDVLVFSHQLDQAEQSWAEEYDLRLAAARTDQASAEACRSWGTSGLGVLGGCALLVVASLLTGVVARPRTTLTTETPARRTA